MVKPQTKTANKANLGIQERSNLLTKNYLASVY